MSLVNEYEFKKCVYRYRGDRYRAGIKVMLKPTLAEASEKKDWRIYQDFAMTLVKRALELYKDERLRIGLEEMVYVFDSSTIELCLKLCPWAEFHHGKGAFKMHTLMDLRGSIPTFVLLTPGKVNDAKVMDKIPVEQSSFYLIDKGYVAFEKLHNRFQKVGAYFVTRAKDNMVYEVLESRPVNKHSGALSDETIRLKGYCTSRKYPDAMRLVVYEDFETVYTQIWIAVCDYLMLIIAKKRYGLAQVFILSLTLLGGSSSRGRISVNFLISRRLPLVFRRRGLTSDLRYGIISPDSSITN